MLGFQYLQRHRLIHLVFLLLPFERWKNYLKEEMRFLQLTFLKFFSKSKRILLCSATFLSLLTNRFPGSVPTLTLTVWRFRRLFDQFMIFVCECTILNGCQMDNSTWFYSIKMWEIIFGWSLPCNYTCTAVSNASLAVPGIDFGNPKKGIEVIKAKPKQEMMPTHHAPIHAGSPRSIVTSSSFIASKSTHRVNWSAPPRDSKCTKLIESFWRTDVTENWTNGRSHSYKTK